MGQADRAPFPGWPKHVDQQRLHEAWRHIGQKTIEWALDAADNNSIAARDCFEMQAQRLQRPAFHQWTLRLQHTPVVADEAN